jgi:UDP-N-acetylglucosamine transferase subunit ALG13
MTRLVFATVGTDHHQFDRMVDWVDSWLEGNAGDSLDALVQIGTSSAPRVARSVAYLGYDAMEDAMRRASAIVTHGGPGSIMLASWLGKMPIVIPRRAALGEHVDNHQVVFTERLAEAGTIMLADSEARLHELLSAAVSGETPAAAQHGRGHVEATVRRFERLVGEMVGDPAWRGRVAA